MGSDARGHRLVLGVAGVLFFISTMILATVPGLFASPDETANAYFATVFSETGRLYHFEPLNEVLGDVLYPRSTISLEGRIVPGGFLGLPVLYGVLASFTRPFLLPTFTPLLAVLAVFAWYGIIRRLFDSRIALISALLLLVHPAWWYYAARGLLPNVLFVSLIVFGVWFLVARPFETRPVRSVRLPADLDVLLAGLMVGLALFVRAAEAPWIAAAGVLSVLILRAHVRWSAALLFFLSIVLALTPMLFLNRSLYGDPFATGYTARSAAAPTAVIPGDEEMEQAPEAETSTTVSLLPFGFHPRTIGRNVMYYGLGLFWWVSILTLIGLPLARPGVENKGIKRSMRSTYLATFFLIGAWLSVLYGSWTIHDNPDPEAITIANSYVRYWLPVFLMTTPFAALAIVWLCERPFTNFARRTAYACVGLLVLALSVHLTFFAPEDGLVAMRDTAARAVEIRTSALAHTEEDAVVIVDRADKLFFPYRRVLYPLRTENDSTYDLMPRIVLRAPLYYFGITFPPQDMEYLNTVKLKERGLQIELVETYDAESLYRITQIP